MSNHSDASGKIDTGAKSAIKQGIELLYSRMKVPYIVTPYNQKFHDLCCKRAIEKGYPMGTDPDEFSLRPFIPAGVIMGSVGFGHLKDEERQLFVAFYTALLIYVDTIYEHDNGAVRVFIERFTRGEKQSEPVLDGLARFLKEIPDHFEPVVASIILTGALNLINASTLEYQTTGMTASLDAKGYAGFTRQMSGASEAYSLMIFPRHLPLQSYIQCIAETSIFLGYSNDVMSFYKEELAEETVNYISVLARNQGVTKITAFQQLAEEVASADAQVCKILKVEPEVLDIWNTFKIGYMSFHSSYGRYRLDEVMNP